MIDRDGSDNISVSTDDAVALRKSYALCRRIHAKGNRTTFLATRLLTSPATRLHADALNAYFFATDRVADEGSIDGGGGNKRNGNTPSAEDRERAFAVWSAAVLADLRRGHSDHPIRRALVHTARVHDLDPALFDLFQSATVADSTRIADFATFDDLRAFMRGVSGTAAVLSVRVLGPAGEDSDRVASLMGEVHQFLDIFEDFPIDLPARRLYLPLEDLDRCGVGRAELFEYATDTTTSAPASTPAKLDALDALIRLQADRARAMLREATSLFDSLSAASRPIIAGSLDIQAAQLDVIERSGARVLREGTKMPRARVLRLVWPHLRAARRSW